MKLLGADVTAQMESAALNTERTTSYVDDDAAIWRVMHNAAPNDATQRLISVLRRVKDETRWYLTTTRSEYHKQLNADVTALLKEICDD